MILEWPKLTSFASNPRSLDTDEAARRPQDQQIVLLNRDEVLRTKERF